MGRKEADKNAEERYHGQNKQDAGILGALPEVMLPAGFRASWQRELQKQRQRKRFLARRRRMGAWILSAAALGLLVFWSPAFLPSTDEQAQESMSLDRAVEPREEMSMNRVALKAAVEESVEPLQVMAKKEYRKDIEDFMQEKGLDMGEDLWLEKDLYEEMVEHLTKQGWLHTAAPWPPDRQDQLEVRLVFDRSR